MTSFAAALAHAADLLDPPEEAAPDFIPHADWCRTNLPHIFTLPYGPHHLDLFNAVDGVPRGVRHFTGAARGSGKTSVASLGLPISAAAQGTHKMIVIIRATQQDASDAVEIIRGELEHNHELVARFPNLELRSRVRVVRAEKESSRELRLRGSTIIGLGARKKVRGLIRRSAGGRIVRPDLVVIDIEEDAEQARSKLRTDRLEEWLMADVGQLGSNAAGTAMDLVAIGTTIDTDALVTRALRKRGRFAHWTGGTYPAEYVDAKGGRRATWPEGQPLSWLDYLCKPGMDKPWLFVGSFTYAKEYLLNPRKRANSQIKADWLKYAKPPGELGRWAALGIDPATDEGSVEDEDYSAAVDVGVAPDGSIYVRRVWRGHVSSKRLFDVAEDMVLDAQGHQRMPIGFEAVAGFAWGLQELRRRNLAHRGVKKLADKVARFQFIVTLYEAGMIFHDPSLKNSEFEDELLDFPTAEHDDMVDALYHAISLATNQGRIAWENRKKMGERRPGARR